MAGWKVGSMLAAALAVVIASSGLVAASQEAEAAITGTAGLYVPSQGRIVDTRNGTGGYSTPFTANATRLVQVTGTQPVPASTVTAVQVVVTAVDPTVQGVLSGGASGGGTSALMVYDGGRGGITSNSAILPVGADGKIQLTTQSTTHVLVDVQGYYTSGNGVTAPGGYHPVDGSRIVDTRTGTGAPLSQVATGQTLTVQATGVGGVPAGASAVYVNVMVRNYGAGAFLTPYAADQARPSVALNFPATNTQAIPLGAQIALSGTGAFKLYLGGASTSVDLFVDIEGYFTSGDSDGAFTPATGRILDTRVAPATAVGPDKTISIAVAGQAGLPSVADGLEAAVLNVTALDGQTGGGFARLWPSDKAEPNPFHNINYSNSTQTNLVTVPIGADGAIKLHNVSGDTVHFVLDLEGFYTPLVTRITTPAPGQVLGTSAPVIAGNGAPGASITVSAGKSPVCTATVDSDGSWRCISDSQLADGNTTLSAAQIPAPAVAVPSVAVVVKAPTLTMSCPSPYTNGSWTSALPAAAITCTIAADTHGVDGTQLVTTLNDVPTADPTPVSATVASVRTVVIPNRAGWYRITAGLASLAGPAMPVTYSFGLNDGPPSDAVAAIQKADPTVFENLAATSSGTGVATQATSADGTTVVVPATPADGISVSTTAQTITDPDTGATTRWPRVPRISGFLLTPRQAGRRSRHPEW